jgi:PST family polysaccharide transporter
LGLERLYNRIVLGGAVVDLLLVAILAPWYRELGVGWALLGAEGFITITVFIVLWRRNLNPFQVRESSPPPETRRDESTEPN